MWVRTKATQVRCQRWNCSLAWSLFTPRRPFLGCADRSGGPPQASSAVFTGGLVPDAACEAGLGEAWRDMTWLNMAMSSPALPGWREALHKSWGCDWWGRLRGGKASTWSEALGVRAATGGGDRGTQLKIAMGGGYGEWLSARKEI